MAGMTEGEPSHDSATRFGRLTVSVREQDTVCLRTAQPGHSNPPRAGSGRLAPALLEGLVSIANPSQSSGQGGSSAAPRVLLIEDNASTSLLLRTILKHEGFIVEACPDGATALETLAVKEFDVIVLDLMMPKVDGVQVLRGMRTLPAHMLTPVIVITAARLSLVEDEVRRLGAKFCLDKTQHDQLPKMVRQLVAERAAQGIPKLRMTEAPPLDSEKSRPDPAKPQNPISRFFLGPRSPS